MSFFCHIFIFINKEKIKKRLCTLIVSFCFLFPKKKFFVYTKNYNNNYYEIVKIFKNYYLIL